MPSGASGQRDVWIDYLRVAAVAAVVVIHVASRYYYQFGKIDGHVWWTANVLNALFRWAVPMFVMISGALLLGKKIGIMDFYRKRAVRLLPPLAFWSAFYLLAKGFLGSGPAHDAGSLLTEFVATGQAHFHLWYLSMFCCLMLFSPFVNGYILGERPGNAEYTALLVLFGALYFLKQAADVALIAYDVTINWFMVFPWYLIYFIYGYRMGRQDIKKRPDNRLLLGLVVLITAAASGLSAFMADRHALVMDWFVLSNTSVLNLALSFAVFCLFKCNAARFKPRRVVAVLADASFGIYLVHPVFLHLARRVLPQDDRLALVCMPLSMLLVFTGSAAAIIALRKFRWFRAVC